MILPNSRMMPSAAPVTKRFPLWLNAMQFTATGPGSSANCSYKTTNTHRNVMYNNTDSQSALLHSTHHIMCNYVLAPNKTAATQHKTAEHSDIFIPHHDVSITYHKNGSSQPNTHNPPKLTTQHVLRFNECN